MVAGAWLRIRDLERRRPDDDGSRVRFEGVGVSAFNQVLGHQQGLTIGIINYARSLSGLQVGLLNIVRDNPPARRALPVVNWGTGRG